MKVAVYRNLHKNCFSVQDWKTKKVIKHSDYVVLQNATFKVSEKGRQKVLETKQKHVHAKIIGEDITQETAKPELNTCSQVRYNPYNTVTFIDENLKPYLTCEVVYCIDNKIYVESKG